MTQKAAAGTKESGISLVAGGSGGIGTAIVRRLVRGGKRLHSLSSNLTPLRSWKKWATRRQRTALTSKIPRLAGS